MNSQHQEKTLENDGCSSAEVKPRRFSQLLRFLSTHALRERRLLAFGFVGLFFAGALNLAFPWLVRALLNEQLPFNLQQDMWLVSLILVGVFLVQAAFFYLRHYCFHAAGHRVVARLRTEVFAALIGREKTFFDQSRVGDLISRLSVDTELIQRAVTVNLSLVARYGIQAIGGLALMVVLTPWLAFYSLLVIPPLLFAGYIGGQWLRRYSREMQDSLAEASVVAEEAFSNYPVVRLFASREFEPTRYALAINEALGKALCRTKVAALFSSGMVFLFHCSLALCLAYGAREVYRENLAVGDLTAFLLYGVIVAVSLAFLINGWTEVAQAAGAAERIADIMKMEPEPVPSPAQPSGFSSDSPVSISFRAVGFSYLSRLSQTVLQDISVCIPAGETWALVGPSGAGKTTFAALALGFYTPTEGQVLWNDRDLSSVSWSDRRALASFVPQDTQVFSRSIAENILYANPNATLEELERICSEVALLDFIKSLPKGLDTLIGDRGVQLSGGQKQRLSIARALIKRPRLLVLDEATSAVDSENERVIQQTLLNNKSGRTTLIIAHRPSTVDLADKIIVLDHGVVVESGSAEELSAQSGLYASLFLKAVA